MASMNERRIRDVRDIWTVGARDTDREPSRPPQVAPPSATTSPTDDTRTRHKYKTLERHLSMKKTIRKKMMRDLREIGDGTTQDNQPQHAAFLEQIKNDQPPPESVEKPSLWRRLTKGWGH